MPRSRSLATAGILALSVAASPFAASVALGADPTVTVQAGDTLTSIAARTGVTIDQLVETNGITNPNRIYAGQRLRLPGTDATLAQATTAPAAAEHVVASGESLWGIARHYGTSVAAIVAANGIANPSFIVRGQRLSIPGTAAPAPAGPTSAAAAAPAATPASSRVVHVVASGESLWTIARHYGTTVAAIVAANGIANPSFIVRGQRLAIPGAAGAAPPVPNAKPVPASLSRAMAARDGVRRLIVAEAQAQGVPVAFALAVAWQESGWQPGVVSHAGAIGVMQLLPTTADWVSEAMLGGASVNLWDARSNIRAGVRLLGFYLDRYDGSRDLALAAYYQGMTAVDRHGIHQVSRPYIASIRALEAILGG